MIKHKKKITIDNKEMIHENRTLLDSFIRSLRGRGLTESTKYNYIRDMEQFIYYVEKDLTEVTSNDLVNYLNTCKEYGNGYSRLERRYRIVQSFYKYTTMKKMLTTDITKSVKISDYK